MADSSINFTLNTIQKFTGPGFREWRSKMRQEIGFHKHEMLPVLAGDPCPASTESNADGIDKWPKTNCHLYSILFFATKGSAHITARAHEGTSTAGSLGHGAAAWAALSARFDGNTEEARRACREKLFSTVTKSREDPSDFFLSKMDDLRARLQDMGRVFPDEI